MGIDRDELSETIIEDFPSAAGKARRYVNEFWTSGQRRCSSIHEISYRACFKPQLPRFFVSLLTKPGDFVYDPFCGRGTTLIESALLGRNVIGNDINPLSRIIVLPRLEIPEICEISETLQKIPMNPKACADIDLSMFFHPRTEAEIVSIKDYLSVRARAGEEDKVDRWIRMVATNRLTGHSPGFFSVYTLPPNQAVTPERQTAINKQRGQIPQYRDTRTLIMKKSQSLLSRVSRSELKRLREAASEARVSSTHASETQHLIQGENVSLVVTSPPFLNVVQYSSDNWLRCWLNDIDIELVEKQLTSLSSLKGWSLEMFRVLSELSRILIPGGYVAFEVGEIRGGSVLLDEVVAPIGEQAGLVCELAVVNKQRFSKTSNIWGISNNKKGTNTNRVILFRKPFQK